MRALALLVVIASAPLGCGGSAEPPPAAPASETAHTAPVRLDPSALAEHGAAEGESSGGPVRIEETPVSPPPVEPP